MVAIMVIPKVRPTKTKRLSYGVSKIIVETDAIKVRAYFLNNISYPGLSIYYNGAAS